MVEPQIYTWRVRCGCRGARCTTWMRLRRAAQFSGCLPNDSIAHPLGRVGRPTGFSRQKVKVECKRQAMIGNTDLDFNLKSPCFPVFVVCAPPRPVCGKSSQKPFPRSVLSDTTRVVQQYPGTFLSFVQSGSYRYLWHGNPIMHHTCTINTRYYTTP